MADRNPVQLPTELWLRVMQNLKTDRTELWTSMRHVSRTFRTAVETIFRERHLPKTWIDIPLGEYYDDDGRVVLDTSFEFSRLSEDQKTAIFTAQCADEYKSEVRSRLLTHMSQNSFVDPGHTVQIRRELNDTPIPGKSINYETLELSCDWRGLYSAFYIEEQCYNNLTKNWATNREAWALDMQAKVQRGEINMQQMILRAIKEFASGSEHNKEISRRARIRRQYKELDGTEWDFDRDGDEHLERDIRNKMNTVGNVIYLQEFSDDSEVEAEDEDEDEDDEDDEEEEDEEDEDENEDGWEDTDGEVEANDAASDTDTVD